MGTGRGGVDIRLPYPTCLQVWKIQPTTQTKWILSARSKLRRKEQRRKSRRGKNDAAAVASIDEDFWSFYFLRSMNEYQNMIPFLFDWRLKIQRREWERGALARERSWRKAKEIKSKKKKENEERKRKRGKRSRSLALKKLGFFYLLMWGRMGTYTKKVIDLQPLPPARVG